MTEEDNFLIDSENYRAGEENKFNHQVLVMKAMQKCLDLGSVEMVEGYWDTKLDKNGNAAKTYHPDTRRAFIESVKSLMMVTEPDYTSKQTASFKIIIDECLTNIEKRKKYWLEQEYNWWLSMNPMQKQQAILEGKQVNRGSFNTALQFDNYFHAEELDFFRKICTTINHVIKAINYFGSDGKNTA